MLFRGLGAVLLALLLAVQPGCGGSPAPTGPPPGNESEVPGLLDMMTGQNKGNMARLYAIRRLGQLGPKAASALDTLKNVRAIVGPDEQKMLDESIAKIEGTAAPADATDATGS